MDDAVRLRPVEESDLALLLRGEWNPDVAGEFQWFGFKMDKVRKLERRWHSDGLIGKESSYLAVIVGEDTCAGCVDWRPTGPYGNYEIGVGLFPEHRGRGIGTEAQRQLVGYLFATTTAHRIQAGTEVDNVAEQRALEKIGFQREGINRGVVFRAGRWRDGLMYGLLREDVQP
jgi:RimJ/RimL family protein N-acetyltransferase